MSTRPTARPSASSAARTSCPCCRPTRTRSSSTRCGSSPGSRPAGPTRRCGPPTPRAGPRSTSSSSGSTASGRPRRTRSTPSSAAREPDRAKIDAWAEEMRGWLHWFEALLEGRDHLMGDAFGAADVAAFPFLKYGVLPRSGRRRAVPPGPHGAPADRGRVPARRGLDPPRRFPPASVITLIPLRKMTKLLWALEEAGRHLPCERTSQVHLLPEADDRPAASGPIVLSARPNDETAGPLGGPAVRPDGGPPRSTALG